MKRTEGLVGEPNQRETPRAKLSTAELGARFRWITEQLYDTRVPISELGPVYACIAPDIEFLDPWVHINGRRVFNNGLRGFHELIRFDFDIAQIAVDWKPGDSRGRAMVDGIMNLRQLGFYTYPLRTILIYEFTLVGDGQSFLVTKLEEMWSLGDLVENLPGIGRLYDLGRYAWGWFFTMTFWVGAKAKRLRRGVAE